MTENATIALSTTVRQSNNQALCDALAREFDASIDTVRVDVIALLDDLYRGKLIEIAA
ncbi:MAG: PqqD family protein [Novosphingobium sp.]